MDVVRSGLRDIHGFVAGVGLAQRIDGLFQKPFVSPKTEHLFPTVSDNSSRSWRLNLIESSL